MADYAGQFRSEFERIRYDTLEVLDAGAHVIARMRVTGTGKSSGADFETEAWWVYEFIWSQSTGGSLRWKEKAREHQPPRG